jgi:hypothetical protein
MGRSRRKSPRPLFFMVEVQAHGFSFEKWVLDTHFAGYLKWTPSVGHEGRAIKI